MIVHSQFLRRRKNGGFTLVELAIVLAVSSLLFAGLWRLMSGGNTMLRDQAVADQQKQVVSSVKGYLAGAQGQSYLGGLAANTTFTLPVGACASPAYGVLGVFTQLCNFFPVGFTGVNSYGQQYSVRVRRGATASNYSFMVLTTGGDTIPDASGGRISGMIGADGGFVYSTVICGGSAANACGAYGGWTLNPVTSVYSFAAAVAGHVASLSQPSLDTSDLGPWLARNNSVGPATEYNRMHTNLDFDTTAGALSLSMGGAANSINMNGGALNLNDGTIHGGASMLTAAGRIDNIRRIFAQRNDGWPGVGTDPIMRIFGTCNGPPAAPFVFGGGCEDMHIDGYVNVVGLLQATDLYALSFLYTSDFRLKHDVKPLKALEDISKIKAISFVLNGNETRSVGVVAQDVEKVYPHLVREDSSGFKGVDYVGLVGPLVGAVNELREQNKALQEQLNKQAREIQKLKKQK